VIGGTPRITVLGIGNPLRMDEGVGVRVVAELTARFDFPDRVQVVDVGTMGMTIMHLFGDCDLMIVVDAVDRTGHEPGSVVVMTPEDLAPSQVMHSLHDVRFTDVLQTAALVGHDVTATVVGVQIADMGERACIGLTPAVEAAVPRAVDAVIELLDAAGAGPIARHAGRHSDVALGCVTPQADAKPSRDPHGTPDGAGN
jgi:hydrogenase maturation protease